MDELSLIVSVQKGEKEAFQSLITFYHPYVSKFLLKMCSDVTLSEDLTQDTFLKLVRGIDKFDIYGKASFSTWVMTIAKNCYIDHLRRNKQEVLSLEEQDRGVSSQFNVQDTALNNLQINEKGCQGDGVVDIIPKYFLQCFFLSQIVPCAYCAGMNVDKRGWGQHISDCSSYSLR